MCGLSGGCVGEREGERQTHMKRARDRERECLVYMRFHVVLRPRLVERIERYLAESQSAMGIVVLCIIIVVTIGANI